ncbi:hypothetical protein G3O06_23575 [Burkholderia sp. Ac-20345]|uniref:hypothetical protein n=1 Tax=Burkholderia sp. Ac-20345 TaxID=2703891 RepID=UPI00197BE7A8|nr:hypothetical protein [Burkholderia sp. Ac-20345]MBN3780498.1 hypothetical protein [Burkholderia sp. Ac-20345]
MTLTITLAPPKPRTVAITLCALLAGSIALNVALGVKMREAKHAAAQVTQDRIEELNGRDYHLLLIDKLLEAAPAGSASEYARTLVDSERTAVGRQRARLEGSDN